MMTFSDQLSQAFPNRVERPRAVSDIPAGVFFVYILTINDRPIVAGHGKKNRARVIFDSSELVTGSHIKAMPVRLYTLFGGDDPAFARYLIRCASKDEAKKIELEIHRKFGGNTRSMPSEMQRKLFSGLVPHTPAWMVLRMALSSSFDGISDLKKWRREGILDDETWAVIADKLKLE